MSDQRDDQRERARRRAGCKRCGGQSVTFQDGAACGGLPGIVYKVCGSCGNGVATKRRKP